MLWIGPAAKRWHTAALRLLEIDDAVSEQLRSALNEGRATICVALRNDALVGAGWCRVQLDGVAILVPPRIVATEVPSTAELLLEQLHSFARDHAARRAQVTLSEDRHTAAAMLVAHGYTPAADLLLLIAATDPHHAAARDELLVFEPCPPSDAPRLQNVLEKTYEGSLDLPSLSDGLAVQSAGTLVSSTALEGRRALESDRALEGRRIWERGRAFIVCAEGEDVGCLLLAHTRESFHGEIVYLGLVPHVRGRGWGHRVLGFAKQCAAEAGNRQLSATADSRNLPAIAAYLSSGFGFHGRATLLIRFW